MKEIKNPYTLDDCECHVEGDKGDVSIHMLARIIKVVQIHYIALHTAKRHIDDCDPCDITRHFEVDKIVESCNDFMDDHFPVEGAFWGLDEEGDWGLWNIEEQG